MPRKIRQLKADLRRAGFKIKAGRGKGDHAFFFHPEYPDRTVVLDGHDGDDAKPYQELDVRKAIGEAKGQEDERRER